MRGENTKRYEEKSISLMPGWALEQKIWNCIMRMIAQLNSTCRIAVLNSIVYQVGGRIYFCN